MSLMMPITPMTPTKSPIKPMTTIPTKLRRLLMRLLLLENGKIPIKWL
jgi:hypothetical protein